MLRPAIAETVSAMRRVLDSCRVTAADVSAMVLVGGSSRIPLVSQMLSAAFGRPLALDNHPKHDVALGAAIRGTPAAQPQGPPRDSRRDSRTVRRPPGRRTAGCRLRVPLRVRPWLRVRVPPPGGYRAPPRPATPPPAWAPAAGPPAPATGRRTAGYGAAGPANPFGPPLHHPVARLGRPRTRRPPGPAARAVARLAPARDRRPRPDRHRTDRHRGARPRPHALDRRIRPAPRPGARQRDRRRAGRDGRRPAHPRRVGAHPDAGPRPDERAVVPVARPRDGGPPAVGAAPGERRDRLAAPGRRQLGHHHDLHRRHGRPAAHRQPGGGQLPGRLPGPADHRLPAPHLTDQSRGARDGRRRLRRPRAVRHAAPRLHRRHPARLQRAGSCAWCCPASTPPPAPPR